MWKDIEGYEGLYQVSDYGRVKSLGNSKKRKEKILKCTKEEKGYLVVNLYKDGKPKRHKIHQLVAQHFIPNPEHKPIVHHIDKNPLNNVADNLMWVTEKEHKVLHPEVSDAASKVRSKPISQYDLDGNFIRVWRTTMEINKELGYSQGNINNCCRGRYKQAYGFLWKYM